MRYGASPRAVAPEPDRGHRRGACRDGRARDRLGYLHRVAQSRMRWYRRKPPAALRPEPPVESWYEPGLAGALAEFTQSQRVAVVLCHGFGLTHRAVAGLLVVSPSTVQNHVEHGLAKLRDRLGVEREWGTSASMAWIVGTISACWRSHVAGSSGAKWIGPDTRDINTDAGPPTCSPDVSAAMNRGRGHTRPLRPFERALLRREEPPRSRRIMVQPIAHPSAQPEGSDRKLRVTQRDGVDRRADPSHQPAHSHDRRWPAHLRAHPLQGLRRRRPPHRVNHRWTRSAGPGARAVTRKQENDSCAGSPHVGSLSAEA